MRRRRRQLVRVRSEASAIRDAESANSEWCHGDINRELLSFSGAEFPRCSIWWYTRTLKLLDSSMRHVKLHYCCGVCT